MQTERICMSLAKLARHDSITGMKLYSKGNSGPMLFQRLSKDIPMQQPHLKGDDQYLRMIYTGMRFYIDVRNDK
jgi:hypothetical protein